MARARSASAQRFFLTLTDGFLAPATSYYLATSLADWFERESSIIDVNFNNIFGRQHATMMALRARATPRTQTAMPISTPSTAHTQEASEIHSSASWGASPRVPSQ